MVWRTVKYEVADASNLIPTRWCQDRALCGRYARNAPTKEVEPLADEQKGLLSREESLSSARDVLVGRILGEYNEGRVDLAEVILHPDEVERGRDEDDRVRALHR